MGSILRTYEKGTIVFFQKSYHIMFVIHVLFAWCSTCTSITAGVVHVQQQACSELLSVTRKS